MARFKRPDQALTLVRIIDLYLEYVGRMLNPKTRDAYHGPLLLFVRFLRVLLGREPMLADLILENVLAWVDALQHEPKRVRGGLATGSTPVARETVRTYLRVLRVFSRWLPRPPYRFCAVDPLADLKLPRATRRFKQPLGQAELNALLAAADSDSIVGRRDRAMLLLLLDGGLRATELARLQRRDLALDQGTVYIAHAKYDQSRIIALGSATLATLRAYVLIHESLVCGAASTVDGSYTCNVPANLDDSPLFPTIHGRFFTYQGLKSWFRRLAVRAGVPSAHLHLMRHTSAAQTLNAGADVRTVQLKLGHRDISTTQRYLHLAQAQIAEREQKYSPVDYLRIGEQAERPRTHRGTRAGRKRSGNRLSGNRLWRRATTDAGATPQVPGDRVDDHRHDRDYRRDVDDDDGAAGAPVDARR